MALSLTEAARRVGCDTSVLRAAIETGRLSATPRGRGFLIAEDALAEAFSPVAAEVESHAAEVLVEPVSESAEKLAQIVAVETKQGSEGAGGQDMSDKPAEVPVPPTPEEPVVTLASAMAVPEQTLQPKAAPALTALSLGVPDLATVLAALTRQQELTRELSLQLGELITLFERALPSLAVSQSEVTAVSGSGSKETAAVADESTKAPIPAMVEVPLGQSDERTEPGPPAQGCDGSAEVAEKDAVPRRLDDTRARLARARALLRGYGLLA